MKKSLIALAVAGVFAAPVMAADMAANNNMSGNTNAAGGITIYGQANISLDAVKNDAGAGTVTNRHISSNESGVGFKGSEDLGSGIWAVWQIEQGLDIDSGTRYNRNTFVGLSGDSWGKLVAGINDTPYKSSTRDWDLFADTIADNRSLMGIGSDIRVGNSVTYTSPMMNSFVVSLSTVAGAETAGAAGGKGSLGSGSLMYHTEALNAAFAYQKITTGAAGSGDLGAGNGIGGAFNDENQSWKLGGSYAMNNMQFSAIYEKVKGTNTVLGTAANTDRSNVYLGGKFAVSPSDAVKVAYTRAGAISGVANSAANQLSIGYDHNMSKRTTVYALWTKMSNDAGAGYTLGGPVYGGALALSNPQAATSSSATTVAGTDPTAISIGIKHSF
ncbi:MAG: porin [Pseudomonadota bacterium]